MRLIWERLFIKEVLKTFLLFLGIFYALYTLIDYASHMSGASYHHIQLKIGEFFTHYLCEFVLRAEILIPFAFLIAVVRVLSQLNSQNELVALLTAGYSKKRLLRPFMFLAIIIVFFLYLNTQIFTPIASKRLQRFDEKYTREKPKIDERRMIHHLLLEDGSTLLYRTFDQKSAKFEEVFWIRSIDEVWRIASLKPHPSPPFAEYVEIFKRSGKDLLTLASAKEEMEISELRFNKKRLMETITPADELSLTNLFKNLRKSSSSNSEKEARLYTSFYRKLALPWLALLAVIGVAPFCLYFTRQLSIFLIYTGAIFGLVAIYLIMDAATVLGERQVVSPFAAIFVPFTFFVGVFIFRFWRMK